MPLFKSHPPAPQPEEMRVGALPTYNKTLGRGEIINATKSAIDTEPLSFLNTLKAQLLLKRNRLSSEQFELNEQNKMIEDEVISVSRNGAEIGVEGNITLKKARTVNISFGMSDSEDSDEE